MVHCRTLLAIICIPLAWNFAACSNVGTEETLRQDIAKLTEGKLKFADDNIPSYKNELPDTNPENQSEYDFIVIGAGTAGATVASRLSEINDATVLLIEAGSKEYPIMDIPLIMGSLQASDEINWKYETESSDEFCRGFTNAQTRWPRGKVMGGSSVLNYMLATRGNKIDYDEWANMTGDESWSYREMLTYLKKLENIDVKDVEIDDDLHNKLGPVHVTSFPLHPELVQAFMEAGKELGYPVVDYNGKRIMGLSYAQSTIMSGEKWSANRAYLHPARNRKNLFLTRNSHVNDILINKQTKLAYGVRFSKSHESVVVKARKEIILSAGAINSPQILMLSGIGPAEHLRDLEIDVVKDVPVGENLMDHVCYGGLIFTTNASRSFLEWDILDPGNSAIKDYITARKGSLAMSPNGALAYLNVDNPSSLNPNIELIFSNSAGIKDPATSESYGILEDYQNRMNTDKYNTSMWTIWPIITNPKSRGRLLLRSKNPNDKPKLYANYLDDPDDIRVLIKGIRAVIEFSKTEALQKYNSQLYDLPLPCKNREISSDAYWECALRTYTMTTYHQSGTCKMGREDDDTSVVNSRLQVIGIKGLRVVDASIMPKIVTGHLNIPIFAIAEKISDSIKKDWGY